MWLLPGAVEMLLGPAADNFHNLAQCLAILSTQNLADIKYAEMQSLHSGHCKGFCQMLRVKRYDN